MKLIKVLWISDNVDERVIVKEVENRLEPMSDAIGGGYIENISGDGWSAYLDEEGKLKGLPVNVRATFFATSILGWPSNDLLCGQVVFMGPVDRDGYDTSVPQKLIKAAKRHAIMLDLVEG